MLVLPEVPIDSPTALANFIGEECKENWDNQRKALLLTSLGIKIRKNLSSGITLESLAPYGLLRFIQNELRESVLIREPYSRNGTIGIIPADAKTENPEALFPARGPYSTKGPLSGAAHRADRRLRYRSALWTALKNPLESGKRRFLKDDFHHFVDVDGDAPIPPNSIELLKSDIVGIEGPLRPDATGAIHQAIEKFLKSNNIDPSRAVDLPQERLLLPSNINKEESGAIGLGSFFMLLSNSDLARISIPLDIVAEALRKLR